MDKLQIMIKTQPENEELEYIVDFPATAEDLPAKHKKALGAPLPIGVDIPELDSILGGSKMRGRPKNNAKDPPWMTTILATVPPANHGAVRAALLANCPLAADSSASKVPIADAPSSHDMPKADAAEVAQLPPIMRFAKKSTSSASSGSLAAQGSKMDWEEELLGIKKRKSATSKDEKEENDEEEEEEEEPDEEEGESENVPMKKPKVAKRPAGAMQPAGAMKRPAAGKPRPAAGKPIMKRPAAVSTKFLTMAQVFNYLKTVAKSMKRNSFTSKAYHAAKAIKLRSGATPAAAKTEARKAYKKACIMYDK